MVTPNDKLSDAPRNPRQDPLVRRLDISVLVRAGKWKLAISPVECGLFHLRQHRSRGPKAKHGGSGDKALTGSSLGAWWQWDRVLPPNVRMSEGADK